MARRAHSDVVGTRFGRDWHRRRNESICDACRLAWNAATRQRIAAARSRGWVRPDREPPTITFKAGSCRKCGKSLARTVLDDPMCAECRGNRPGYNLKISLKQRLDIYDRDGWICQICTEAVDPNAPKNSTWDATLDHIVPRSRGGLDEPSNLRLAHRWCNSVRGDLSHYKDDDLRVV